MAKKKDPDPSDKRKRGSAVKKSASTAKKSRTPTSKRTGASAKKGGVPARKAAPAKPFGRRTSPEDSGPPVLPVLTLEQLIARKSLIEKSKSPPTFLLDQDQPANQGAIWLCWPDGSISIDDLSDQPQQCVFIEKSKAGP
jgi:hypothetical protein